LLHRSLGIWLTEVEWFWAFILVFCRAGENKSCLFGTAFNKYVKQNQKKKLCRGLFWGEIDQQSKK
jgi:hypothetical protein